MSMTIDSSGDLELKARDEDLSLYANDDVRFTTNWDNNGTEHSWRMSEIGQFELPGAGYIENPINSSGDNGSSDTIKIVPDADLLEANIDNVDQYIVIDPTGPNHIHIRAGGVQDYSTADLILGGERARVKVSDTGGTTVVQAKQEDYNWTYENINGDGGPVYSVDTAMAEPDINDFMIMDGAKYVITSVNRDEPNGVTSYETTPSFNFVYNESYTFTRDNGEHAWTFSTAGYLNGPTETGHLRVMGIMNDDGDIYVQSDQDVVIGGGGGSGEFLNDATDPDNQIATIGDLSSTSTTSFQSVRYTPTFTATGLTFTGTGATHPTYNSYYVKQGQLVSFVIEVNLSTVTNFGTGQYKLQLPFTPQFGFNHFTGWAWADPDVDPDTGTGHTIINADTAGVTDVLDLHYLKSSGGANSPIREGLFVQGTPVTLSTISKIYINGTYIAAS
jgi:hypothetical protein